MRHGQDLDGRRELRRGLRRAQNPDCTDADGAAVLRKSGSAWKVAYQNSGQEGCPKQLPQAVAIDSRICSRPSKRVYIARLGQLSCKPFDLKVRIVLTRPGTCGRSESTAALATISLPVPPKVDVASWPWPVPWVLGATARARRLTR